MVNKRTGSIQRHENLDTGVLERLVGAYQLAELCTGLQVLHRCVQATGSAAAGFRRQQQGPQQTHIPQRADNLGTAQYSVPCNLYAAEVNGLGAARGVNQYVVAPRFRGDCRCRDHRQHRLSLLLGHHH